MILIVPEGAHAARLGNDAEISQPVKVTTASTYSILFSAARTCSELESLNVLILPASQTIDLQTLYSVQGWDTYPWAFQAKEDDGLVVFKNPGTEDDPTCGPIIDGIAIKELFTPDKTKETHRRLLIKASIATAAAGFGILMIVIICLRRKLGKSMVFWRKKTEMYQNVETFLKNYGSLAPKRYCYSDVKKMTNSFKEKLGQGGYGCVYKGKLCSGTLVAVKVLSESKGNGDEFINEVATISRTSHVNIVTLLGFCFEGRKRALIYEFMTNGSLEKFVYDGISSTNRQLGWEKSYHIAIGIARGLEYLHRGCNTQILHFDIKPHNILLDEDFSPKISDFGLAKLCPRKESIISMLTARGTIGYIAPEVFCRNFGRVSHKSDVYSYGMMVLEMVGGRKNIEVEVDRTSEIYFPDWIYKQLESEELGLYGIMNEEENEMARKMIIVSLWCIQTDPSTRPSMTRVVEMLEGSFESLKVPPKPLLSSTPRPPVDSSTSTIEIS